MFFIPDVYWITTEDMEQLFESFRGVVWDVGGSDGGGSEEPFAGQPGEEFTGLGEVDREVEAEEVGGVALVGKDVPGDAKMGATYEDVEIGFVELGDEFGEAVELRVGK